MPVGTQVRIHGRDRHGFSTELDCTVVQYGKGKRLSYHSFNGGGTRPIISMDGAVHYYSVLAE